MATVFVYVSTGIDDKKREISRLRFWIYHSDNQQDLPHLKMDMITLFTVGFVLNVGLRDLCPSTQQRMFRYRTCISVFLLSALVQDLSARYVISPDLAATIYATCQGIVFSDLFALLMHVNPCNKIEHPPSIQETESDHKDKPIDPANGSVVAKPKQPEPHTDSVTKALHEDREAVISGAAPNKNDKYQARAYPNERLKVAFRINNCFTNDKQERCDDFRKTVEELLHPAKDNYEPHWRDLVETARTVAKAELSGFGAEKSLFDAVQMTVMKTMLKVLFQRSPADTTKDRHIRRLAKEINKQWVKSKDGLVSGETPDWGFEQQKVSKSAAEHIFGEWQADNTDNPFNFLLPGYETMWRVVLRAVIELTSTRHPTDSLAWKERLAAFMRNPTRDQLQKEKNADGLTAQHVSFETLRLYPPTRRFSREKKYDDGSTCLKSANIEEMHHKAPTWKPDPESFRPERWTALPNGIHTKGFMPFGCYPFNCPAKQSWKVPIPFGVSMIAVLAGCFIEAMGDEWCLIGEQIPPASDPIRNGREDCSEVSLYRLGADPGMLTLAEQKLFFGALGADNAVTDDTVTGNTAANNTATSNTASDNTAADNTGTDNTGVEDTNADDTESNKTTNANKADDDKAEGEAKAEINETNGSDGEGEKQIAGVQQ